LTLKSFVQCLNPLGEQRSNDVLSSNINDMILMSMIFYYLPSYRLYYILKSV